jgi:hypothetical protein
LSPTPTRTTHRVALVLFAIVILGAGNAAARQAGATRFSLSRAPSPDASIRFIGRHWRPASRITVSVRYFGITDKKTIRARAQGTFEVKVDGVQWCSGLTVRARDRRGHEAVIHALNPSRPCTPPPPGSPVVLRVLPVHQMPSHVLTLDTRRPEAHYSMHLGDVLYLYTPGTTVASFLPTVDAAYLFTVEQGTIPPCPPGAACRFPQGFFWRFQADRTGATTIDLSPACRRANPPCGAPDRIISIDILP